MTRKQFIFAPIAVALLSTGSAQPPAAYGAKEEQEFAAAFNNWATTANQNGLVINVKEIKAWHVVKAAWSKLYKVVEQSYK